MRRTKIVCTLGPASCTESVIEDMLKNGMNVARLNFSHGTNEYHKEMIATFRKVRDRLKLPAAVLLDTKGPEIRTRLIENDKIDLEKGDSLILTTDDESVKGNRVSITYADLPSQLKGGEKIVIDDGKLSFA